jgi:hypothetical protein
MQLDKKQFGPAWRIELINNLNIYIPFIIELCSHNRAADVVSTYTIEFQVNVSYIVDFQV